ncbi:MAG: class I SAM-dependent methyltransferase [Planctomycetes bacterium]|nr:class I SAM-dependent methyltransferase [Planctomycetota bacterium]
MYKRVFCLVAFAVGLAIFAGDFLSADASRDKAKAKDKSKDDKFKPKYDDTTYVPTADEVIEKMFEMAKVNEKDVIFDLGCGDNRILYMAAKKFGCRGVGIDINPDRIREAMDQYEKFNGGKDFGKLLSLVELRHGDAFKVKDIGDASVVAMYMFPKFMNLWFPIAKEKLKPGTRIVSHDYEWEYETIPDAWRPVAEATVKSSMREGHKVYLWIVPEKKKNN